MITQDQALSYLRENIKNENLIKHSLAVAEIMKILAEHFNEDREKWYLAGLLHDIDYEKTKSDPENHSKIGSDMLRQKGFDEEICQSVLTHNEIHGIEPTSLMAKALFCADPLSGLIVASTLVLPSKKIKDLKIENILNRFKEKSFARGVNRQAILRCEPYLGLSLEDFTNLGLKAMVSISDELGL